jgi:hypothetical protein
VGYEISRDGLVTIFRFESPITLASVQAAIEESDTLTDSRFELWDLSHPTIEFSADELKELASLARSKSLRPAKTAIVASDDLSYGLSRVYAAYRDQTDNVTRVFRDTSLAHEWLTTDAL